VKIERHDTVIRIEASDDLPTVTDWQGTPFKIYKIVVYVYPDRAVLEVAGNRNTRRLQGTGTAKFKIGGDAKYRDCPQWLIDKLVELGVMLWEVKVG
jgi:hypothetical protein